MPGVVPPALHGGRVTPNRLNHSSARAVVLAQVRYTPSVSSRSAQVFAFVKCQRTEVEQAIGQRCRAIDSRQDGES